MLPCSITILVSVWYSYSFFAVSVVHKTYINNLSYSSRIALYCPGNNLTSIRYSVVSIGTYRQITEYNKEQPTAACFPIRSIVHPTVRCYVVPVPASDVKKNTKGMIRKLANFESQRHPRLEQVNNFHPEIGKHTIWKSEMYEGCQNWAHNRKC